VTERSRKTCGEQSRKTCGEQSRTMAKVTKEQKVKIVESLRDKFSKAVGLVLTDYHGLSVSQMQELKKGLKAINSEFTIAKNTLIDRAAKQSRTDLPAETLVGPTAILFSYGDPLEGIKKLADFIKNYELPKIKIGLLEGSVLPTERVMELAKIPGRIQLYANLASSLNSPIYGFVAVLNGNLRNLVFTLGRIKAKRGG